MFQIDDEILPKIGSKNTVIEECKKVLLSLENGQSVLVQSQDINGAYLRKVVHDLSVLHNIRLRVERIDDSHCRVFKLPHKSEIMLDKIKGSQS